MRGYEADDGRGSLVGGSRTITPLRVLVLEPLLALEVNVKLWEFTRRAVGNGISHCKIALGANCIAK